MSEHDSTKHRTIVDKYLTLSDVVRDGHPRERLTMKWPELESDLVVIGEGSSMRLTREAVAAMLGDMIDEAVFADREACADALARAAHAAEDARDFIGQAISNPAGLLARGSK